MPPSPYSMLRAVTDATPRGLVRAVVRRVPDVMVTRNVRHVDGPLAFGLRRHHWLFSPRCFEGHGRTLGLFRHMTRDGDVFYDVGGNIGYYARWVLTNLPVSRAVAFEPMAANVRLLRRNRDLAPRADAFDVYDVALSDRDGEAELQTDDQSDGSAVLSRLTDGRASESRAVRNLEPLVERVREVRLDRWLEVNDASPPDVMKIDTEGAEHLVVAGASGTLRRHGPRLILAIHGSERGRLLADTLAEAGYVMAGWLRDGDRTTWSRVEADDVGRLYDNNVVASRDPADLTEPAVLRL